MTPRAAIFCFISSLAISLSLSLPTMARPQSLPADEEAPDSVPLFNGFAVGVDLAGLVQYAISDYGQWEGSLRLNLRDRYFPIVELGIGKASHDDEVTRINYRSSSPYFRLGMDLNMMKNKHDDYRIYVGARYGFTFFKYDFSIPDLEDPGWGGVNEWGVSGVKCNCHWAELVAGVDAKIWGPVHLGWTARYRKRLSLSSGENGDPWYIPGYGKSDGSSLGFVFVLSLDI